MGVEALNPQAPAAPPRERTLFTPVPSPPNWPTVLGVLAIIFGTLGALGGCMGAMSLLFFQPLGQAVAQHQQPNPFEFVDAWMGWIIGLSIATVVVAALLATGGIGLVRRSAWSRGVILAWVAVKMLFVVVQVLVNHEMQKDEFAALAESGVNASGAQWFLAAIGVAGVVIGILWGWALPVFMLIWFSRAKVKAQVNGWSARESSPPVAV